MSKRARNKREELAGRLKTLRFLLFVAFLFSMPLFFLPGNTEYGYTKSIYTLCFVALLYIVWGGEALVRRR